MSARIPTRQLGQSSIAALRSRSIAPARSFSCALRLKAEEKDASPKALPFKEEVNKIKGPAADDPLGNPILEKFLERHTATRQPTAPALKKGTLSNHPSSMFKPEIEIPGWREGMSAEETQRLTEIQKQRERAVNAQREQELRAVKLDPAPAARLRFEKKLAIKDVLRNGRVSKALKLARTERQSIYKSPFLPTSVKKLTRIMHLIAGKTVEEALIQLRFSKKRVARDVRKGLMIARDEAIAKSGMGLGGAQAARDAWAAERAALEAELEADPSVEEEGEDEFEPYFADGTRRQERQGEGRLIELRDGTKKRVYDETEIYIDQAWVGRGEKSLSPEFRARGRINMLTHRTTMFTVLLKEEKTRIRLHEEMQKKRENKKLWVPLPDRPVTSQRQYCLW